MSHYRDHARNRLADEPSGLNITPLMNLVSILIPVLLVSATFVEMVVLEADGRPESDPSSETSAPPVQPRIIITQRGLMLSPWIHPAGPAGAPAASSLLIPIAQQKVSCQPFLDSWPPPRDQNRSQRPCRASDPVRRFWSYDFGALIQRLTELKAAHPDSDQIVLTAEADIEFQTIAAVMDACRSMDVSKETPRPLFNQIYLQPPTDS